MMTPIYTSEYSERVVPRKSCCSLLTAIKTAGAVMGSLLLNHWSAFSWNQRAQAIDRTVIDAGWSSCGHTYYQGSIAPDARVVGARYLLNREYVESHFALCHDQQRAGADWDHYREVYQLMVHHYQNRPLFAQRIPAYQSPFTSWLF